MSERCERCDMIKGDDDRADALPLSRLWATWKRGDAAPRPKWSEVVAAIVADQPDRCTMYRCIAVDWRARCLAAEAERDAMRPVVDAAVAIRDFCDTDSPKCRAEPAPSLMTLMDAVAAYVAAKETP